MPFSVPTQILSISSDDTKKIKPDGSPSWGPNNFLVKCFGFTTATPPPPEPTSKSESRKTARERIVVFSNSGTGIGVILPFFNSLNPYSVPTNNDFVDGIN